ncbi:MAG: hypothetical protein A2Z97_13305 [Bdellovibrionales bacterium GWB1_52_6]|nr:MAG: hypothetical protein A2Z97_13305 [Bdellovibrionales bacterium GWB1_52_6]OFZ05808.1 MAG: hypothetical protein A2X97_03850 [Bdellovibrionales bacterium GWA1_52_35]HCM40250.1 hypothetical protein [Bdellovibrionales bacterium]
MKRIVPCSLLILFSNLLVTGASATESTESSRSAIRETHSESPVNTSPEEEENRLTKNWGGFRSRLSAQGVDLGLIYKGQYDSLRSGGLEPGSLYVQNIDLRLALDLEKLAGWTGGSMFFYGLFNHGGETSSRVGDEQVTSNIESPKDLNKLYEAWLQQTFFDGKVSVLAGLHDLNSEFYVTDTSTLFFNSSFGVGRELSQTGAQGPSIFPTAATSLRIRTEPTQSFYFQFGIFNAVASELEKTAEFRFKGSDGALLISEMAYHGSPTADGAGTPHSFKYALGFWAYSTTSDHLLSSIDPAHTKSVNQGAYLLIDQGLTSHLSAFARYGIANTEINPISSNLSGGVVYTGLIPTRDQDRLGFGVTHVRSGSEYKTLSQAAESPVLNAETTFELNYRFEAIPGIAVQPDVQWVKNPSADPAVGNATVLSARLEISL